MTLKEQIQFVEAMIADQERRAKMCRSDFSPGNSYNSIIQELAETYERKAQGLREVAETLYRYQSLWS